MWEVGHPLVDAEGRTTTSRARDRAAFLWEL